MAEHALRGFSDTDRPRSTVYDTCIRCGLCLPSCPTYLETMTETSGPRGRISLIKAVGEGRLDVHSPGFVGQMWECLDCRACEAVCPSGVAYSQLIETARAQVERAKSAPDSRAARTPPRWLLHTLFGNLAMLRWCVGALRWLQRFGLMAVAARFGLAGAALARELPQASFAARGQHVTAAPSAGVAFLFAGCIMSAAFGDVHEATIRMLRRAGLSTVVPPAQGCCGAIAVHAGDRQFARRLARRNIVGFEESGADVYVVNAAGCGSMLKEYGRLFEDDERWRERAARFSGQVRDVTEVLDAMELPPPARRITERTTYQEPCHLAHAQRITAAPRRLLARVLSRPLIEMHESAVCCGSAGIYNLTQPQMARRLQRRKAAAIANTGATTVATANPGCALQVAAGLREAGYAGTVRHVVEILDDAYSEPG
ncbi:MAG: 4Fe-4S dicluster domain-containing protein [Candidatus Eremiobacteraeota bacterium]|nr:4Fe-4S dicluster domain-containing protein [Candidatus Eremiobacteraeota bacterium]MBV9057310.1 4Fe-4S dicluster domain-containing protein [Candidatus Eremiobacteraeota bacterium]